jgi:hypothetical protein
MKFFILILALLTELPTAQAEFCAMDQEPETTQAADGHDCCPGESEEEPASEDGCSGAAHCGMCGSVVMAPASDSVGWQSWHVPYARNWSSSGLPPSHASPPFRPPIA